MRDFVMREFVCEILFARYSPDTTINVSRPSLVDYYCTVPMYCTVVIY